MKLIQTIIAALIIATLCLWEHPRADVTIGSNFDVTTSGNLNAAGDLSVSGASTLIGDVALTNGLYVGQGIVGGGTVSDASGNMRTRPMQAVGAASITLAGSQSGWWVTLDSTGGASTVSMPATPSAQVWYTLTRIGAGTSACTVGGNGNNFLHPTLGAVASFTLGQFQSVEVCFDGANWLVH